MSILNLGVLHRRAHLTQFHAGHAGGVAVLTCERRGDVVRTLRVLRIGKGYAKELDLGSDPSQTFTYHGSEQHCKNDEGTWQREARAAVTIEGSIRWRCAGVETEGESVERFRRMQTDMDALGLASVAPPTAS